MPGKDAPSEPNGIVGVMDQLEEETDGDDEVGIESVLDAFGGRVFGPVILVPALIVLTPVGGIPLVPTTVGLIVATISAQRVFGKRHPWFPRFIRARSVDRAKLMTGMHKIRGAAKFIDRPIGEPV